MKRQPQALNCPTCGAPVPDDAVTCGHCSSRLATVACSSCFGMMIIGTRFCPRCGAEAKRSDTQEKFAGQCPRCSVLLLHVTVGSTALQECGRCHGLWVDAASFQKICEERERPAPFPATISSSAMAKMRIEEVKYVRCPECRQLMHRVNFANCSGVIVDVCKKHGTWFDRDELTRIIEFLRSGGMERSRERQIAEAVERERRLRALEQRLPMDSPGVSSTSNRDFLPEAVLFAADLGKFFK